MLVSQRRVDGSGGFTLIEVILAISVLAIVLAAVSVTIVSSIQQNASAGSRSQATQVLNYFGRRIAGGEITQLGGTSWEYGELSDSFSDLRREANLANMDAYRAEILQVGTMGLSSTFIPQFRVTVCWFTGQTESCVSGDTAGPGPGGSSGEMLPGVN